jgi:hypothetical protein
MFPILATLLLFGAIAKIWYSIPLIVVISLCYGATRHEHLREIFTYAARTATWILMFMGAIFAVVWVSGYFL